MGGPRPDQAPRWPDAATVHRRGRASTRSRSSARAAPTAGAGGRGARRAARGRRRARASTRARARRRASFSAIDPARWTTGSPCSRRSSAPSTPPPQPGAKAFVEEGDIVEPGQTVCIVEAMKLMNEVAAAEAGRVVEIFVENGDWVEFEQVLMYLEPASRTDSVREGPDRQSRRDRAASRPRLPRAGHQVGRGLLDRGCRVGRRASSPTRPVHVGPPAVGKSYLHIPNVIGAALKTGRRRDPPGLRLPLRGPVLRRDLRRRRDHVHRAEAGRDGEGGRQGDRPRQDAEGRPAAVAGHDRARVDGRGGA